MCQRGWCSSTRHTTSEIVTAIAVKEWLENPADYQGFLTIDDESNGEAPLVIHEAPKFLQPGYFHGPLANTRVTAISNVLNISIIIFSSALHHPIIYILPRKCTVSAPLYAAFNQHGEGHYDAITFQNTPLPVVQHLNVVMVHLNPTTTVELMIRKVKNIAQR